MLACNLPSLVGKTVSIIGKLVHVKRTMGSNDKMMSFGVFVDYEGYWIDTVQFPHIAAQYPFRGGGVYLIVGKVITEFGFVSIEASELHRLPNINMEEPSTRLRVPDKYDAKSKSIKG